MVRKKHMCLQLARLKIGSGGNTQKTMSILNYLKLKNCLPIPTALYLCTYLHKQSPFANSEVAKATKDSNKNVVNVSLKLLLNFRMQQVLHYPPYVHLYEKFSTRKNLTHEKFVMRNIIKKMYFVFNTWYEGNAKIQLKTYLGYALINHSE